MKKSVAAAIAALLVIGFIGNVSGGPAQGINDRGRTEHLYLHELDTATGENVRDGAWGDVSFTVCDGTDAPEKFVFSGHCVTPLAAFGLIHYLDPWPEMGFLMLGAGTSDESGDLHIAGDFDFDAIPVGTDAHREFGARIWLVPMDDAGTDSMAGWIPAEYLFE